jgi:EmrB/QacA subfamily drug resistance transporter
MFENPAPEKLYANKWRIWGVVMIGLFMALIDITIVNITIPQLERDLHASVDTVSWVLNAYNIMFALLLVSMGRLADQFGRKRFFLIGMSIFTAGSLLCAISTSTGTLITFRIVQAVGAGILAPIALAMTTLVFPPAQRGFGLGLMAMVANFAAAIGPPLGGVLVEFAKWPWDSGWHWIFLINVPIGIVGILLALRVMPETRDPHAGTEVDWGGMVTLGGSVFCLTYGLVEANNKGWGSPLIVSLFVASALLALAFALTQRYGRYPMLTPALVRNGQFMGASVTLLLFAIGMMGTLFLMVLAFVNLWHYSELEAAFAISPIAITGLLVSPIVGRLSSRVQPRFLGLPALLLMSGGLVWLSGFPAEPEFLDVLPALVLIGAAVGAAFPSVTIGSMGSITGHELGLGSGIVNMSRQVGFAIGVALLVAVFTGTIDNNIRSAQREVAALYRKDCADSRCQSLTSFFKSDPADPNAPRLQPHNATERRAQVVVDEHVRDSYATAMRVAAFVVLLGIPFVLTMRRRPGEAAAADAAAAAVAG